MKREDSLAMARARRWFEFLRFADFTTKQLVDRTDSDSSIIYIVRPWLLWMLAKALSAGAQQQWDGG